MLHHHDVVSIVSFPIPMSVDINQSIFLLCSFFTRWPSPGRFQDIQHIQEIGQCSLGPDAARPKPETLSWSVPHLLRPLVDARNPSQHSNPKSDVQSKTITFFVTMNRLVEPTISLSSCVVAKVEHVPNAWMCRKRTATVS